jgi:glycosyltransferase involved in cell wall biosynthesis
MTHFGASLPVAAIGDDDRSARGWSTRIAMIITGLGTGGAEMMLLRLLENIDRDRFHCHVFSLTSEGDIGPRIRSLNIPVEAIGMQGNSVDLRAVLNLSRKLRAARFELVHTWMYHSDLLGGIAGRLAGIRAVAWGVHNSTLDRRKTAIGTRLVVRLNALVSRWVPARILCCAEAARRIHVGLGYASSKFTVIPNGFDLSRFQPDAAARDSVRLELGIPIETKLVGVVGRFHPQKNHAGFLQAASLLHKQHPEAHFVLVGEGLNATNAELVAFASGHGIADRVHWMGRRDDIARLMSSLDVLVSSSSFGEAFPIVLGEAMACGVPCVTTDVGDSAEIVGATGFVVPPGDAQALASAVCNLLDLDEASRRSLGGLARGRVQQLFDIRRVAKQYEDFYTALLARAN